MRRTWGMFYSGECPQNSREFRQTFRGMSWKIPGNVLKYSRECRWTFREMLPNINIAGNVVKNSGDCSQRFGECRWTFRGMSPNISGNVVKNSGECRWILKRMSPNIPGIAAKQSREGPRKIQRTFANDLRYVVKRSVESMKTFGWMYIIGLDTGDHELYLFIEEPLLLKSTSHQLGWM